MRVRDYYRYDEEYRPLTNTNTLFVFQKVDSCEAVGCTAPETVMFADTSSGAFATSAEKPKDREVLNAR